MLNSVVTETTVDRQSEPIPTDVQQTKAGHGHRLNQLDGLRAVAVLLVLLTHHRILNAGWIGVDFFFALSGFLITSILRRMRTSTTFWRDFWAKRITRIMPPLVLAIAICTFFKFGITVRQALMYLVSLGDLMAILRPADPLLRPLWSLAVEEHFYLLWPFAVRFLNRKHLFLLLSGLLIAEPIARGVFTHFVPGWAIPYFLTPFRLDGLCFGALLALIMESQAGAAFLRKWSTTFACSITAIWLAFRLGMGLNFTREHPTPIFNALCYSLVPMAAVFLVAHLLNRPESILARVLSWKPLVQIGLISYGVYLFHELGIATLLRIAPSLNRQKLFLINLPAVLLFSWLSFRFYELPIMRAGKRITERPAS